MHGFIPDCVRVKPNQITRGWHFAAPAQLLDGICPRRRGFPSVFDDIIDANCDIAQPLLLRRSAPDQAAKHWVTIGRGDLDQAKDRPAAAFRGEASKSQIAFANLDLLWRILTPARQRLLQTMAGKGELSVEDLARRIHRDPDTIAADLRIPCQAGLV